LPLPELSGYSIAELLGKNIDFKILD
jgi:hypothetical protein